MMSGEERAALAVRALESSDQDWILKQLDDSERERLARALAEVDAGSAPIDADDLAPLLEHGKVPRDALRRAREETLAPRQRVHLADAAEMARLLAAEPDWMVAAVCGARDWPWLEEFMRMLEPARLARVRRYLRTQPSHGAAVQDALLDAISRRLLFGTEVPVFHLTSEAPARVLRPRRRPGGLFGRLSAWLL